ncbi:MAG: hypothetical protein NTZ44_00865 [Candidatus Nomurabacteria bacterium]|nr:hypothetical protein [Candidatus Nomurabacteria bacterium]
MNNFKKGFTSIEMIVVLGIIVLLFLIVLPSLNKMRESQTFKNTAQDVFSSLDKARSQTLASVNSSSYGVHFQSDKVVIFTGTTYSGSAITNVIVNISTPITISNVTIGGVSSTSGDIYFNRLTGEPNQSGSVTLSANSVTKVITISATGSVSIN